MGIFQPTLQEAVIWLRDRGETDDDMDVAAVQKVESAVGDFERRRWGFGEAARHFGVGVDVIETLLELLLTEGFEDFFVGRFGEREFTIGRIPKMNSHEKEERA